MGKRQRREDKGERRREGGEEEDGGSEGRGRRREEEGEYRGRGGTVSTVAGTQRHLWVMEKSEGNIGAQERARPLLSTRPMGPWESQWPELN